MKSLLLSALICCPLHSYAGELNILHVAAEPAVAVEITAQGKSQTIQLEAGKNSGVFTLPDALATLKATDAAGVTVNIPAGDTSHIAILFTKGDSPEWHLIPTKKGENKNSLRVLNLTDGERNVLFGGQTQKVDSFKVSDLGQTDQPAIKIQVDGGKTRSIKPEDAGAYLAIIYPSAEGTKVSFIAE